MESTTIKYILTDIEGTTTSVSFVYEILFPYFRNNIQKLNDLQALTEVQEAFKQTIKLAKEENGIELSETSQIIDKLLEWSKEDKKITPLKTLQGVLWEEGYKSGELKGHIYPDVAKNLEIWKIKGLQMGIFSSGSVSAQKLLFGFSEQGDLTQNFSHYFDTKTGGKREQETYIKISEIIQFEPSTILFLSDIKEELEAASSAGYQTIQLVREGNSVAWNESTSDFTKISEKLGYFN